MNCPALLERPVGIVSDLPRMTVGIDEHPRVSAPERLGSRACDSRARGRRFCEHLVHRIGRVDVIRQRYPAPAATVAYPAVLGELVARPEGDDEAASLEEHDVVLRV